MAIEPDPCALVCTHVAALVETTFGWPGVPCPMLPLTFGKVVDRCFRQTYTSLPRALSMARMRQNHLQGAPNPFLCTLRHTNKQTKHRSPTAACTAPRRTTQDKQPQQTGPHTNQHTTHGTKNKPSKLKPRQRKQNTHNSTRQTTKHNNLPKQSHKTQIQNNGCQLGWSLAISSEAIKQDDKQTIKQASMRAS